MGATKRLMEEDAATRSEALSYLIDQGAIEICENHDIPFEGGTSLDEVLEDVEGSEAYKELLTSVYHENAADECYACAKNRDSD